VVVNRWRQNEGAMLAALEKHSSQSIVTRLPNDYRQRNEALTARVAADRQLEQTSPLASRCAMDLVRKRFVRTHLIACGRSCSL
jgi:hypothetical protein